MSERKRLIAKSEDPENAAMPWAANFYDGEIWMGAVYCRTWLEALDCAVRDARSEAAR